MTRNLLPVRSIKLPPSLARNSLMDGAEQYIQTNDHVSELASNGFFGSHHIVNVINTINLGFAHRSMKCLSHESQCLYKTRLHLALQRHPNIIPQHSHAYHAGLSNTPFLRRQAFPIEIERTIPSRLSMSREDIKERQRLLNGLFNMRYSPVLSNEQQSPRRHSPWDFPSKTTSLTFRSRSGSKKSTNCTFRSR